MCNKHILLNVFKSSVELASTVMLVSGILVAAAVIQDNCEKGDVIAEFGNVKIYGLKIKSKK